MKHRGFFLATLLLLLFGAVAFRIPSLGNRPMHGDEAVHAFKFRDIWEKGVYRYDPNEYHGPTLYYASLPAVWLKGRKQFSDISASDYRLAVALFGSSILLWYGLLGKALGKRPALWAGLLTAISPAFVFYSRYFIQETLLAFFTMGMIACGWRYASSLRPGWLLLSGLCAGLMIASKETAILSFGAAGVALGLTQLWTHRFEKRSLPLKRLWNGKLFVSTLGATILAASLFLSGFFSNLSGPLNYLSAYTPWFHRAQGTDIHRHTWHYYWDILLWSHQEKGYVWSEGLIVGMALVGMVVAFFPGNQKLFRGNSTFARFITFYTLFLAIIYSVIPYKTPWCVLGFLNGLILLAGIGADALIGLAVGKWLKGLVGFLLVVGCVQLGIQAYRASYLAYADPQNPYVYAQTVPDILNLEKRIETLSHSSPQREEMVIKVFSVDGYYWPLPWYLRRFSNVGYWTEVPEDANAPLIIASPEFDEVLSKKLDATHLMNGYFAMRPGVFFEVWVRMDLWKAYLDARKAEKNKEPEASPSS